jgi:hypothetical protein
VAEGYRPGHLQLQIQDGQANLQLSFQLGRSSPSPSCPKDQTPKKERDRARTAAHHARRAAVTATESVSDASSEVSPGSPVLTPPSLAPDSGGTTLVRRPSTRSTTVLVKMKMTAFARSAAEISLKETLPHFIPGFREKIEYFMKDCDFGDGNKRKYFNKYSNMFVFGFYLEKEIVTEELLRMMSSQWASKDNYWDHRPSEVIDIVI